MCSMRQATYWPFKAKRRETRLDQSPTDLKIRCRMSISVHFSSLAGKGVLETLGEVQLMDRVTASIRQLLLIL